MLEFVANQGPRKFLQRVMWTLGLSDMAGRASRFSSAFSGGRQAGPSRQDESE